MISSRASLVRFSRQLTQVERTGQTVQELGGLHGIYLDDTLYSGVNGVIIYEALKLSTPIACKFFPSTRKTDAEKEWRINRKLHEEVNNSSNVIKYHDHVVASSGGHYLVMANYGKWSLKDVQASLKCLHLIGYSHLDIKLQSIMLSSDGTPTIIDLGSCQKAVDKASDMNGLTPSYAKWCLHLAESNSHYDLLCLSLVLYFLHIGREVETSNLKGHDQNLEFADDSQYGEILKSGSGLDDIYQWLKEKNLWDASVAWPSLKHSSSNEDSVNSEES